MKQNSSESIFHAELDNLVFDTSLLGQKIDSTGSGFFLLLRFGE